MVLTGTLTLTADVNFANAAMFTDTKILLLSEEQIQGLNQSNNIVPATILLPPYPSVMAELDGDIEMAYNQYIGYLTTKEPSMFICAVITALMNGTNMILLLGQNESEMRFVEWLYGYLANNYGIIMQTDQSPFMYNNQYDPIVLSSLYGYNLIGYDQFLSLYPIGVHLPAFVLPKLVMEMNPYVENPSEEAYTKYFEGYISRSKGNNGFLINPLARG